MKTENAIIAIIVGIIAMPAVLPPAGAEALIISDEAIVNSGYHVYRRHCVGCHGEDATGGGASALLGTVATPDLTTLAKRNGGQFPFWALYETISGNELLPAHGTRLMPIWGQELAAEPGGAPSDRMARVRGRILALMAYLATLQHD